MFLGPFLITHYVSLGSLLMYGGVLIQMVISGQCGLFSPTSPSGLMEMYIIQAVLTGMAWYRHRANIQRLLSGTESKTYLSHKTNEDIR